MLNASGVFAEGSVEAAIVQEKLSSAMQDGCYYPKNVKPGAIVEVDAPKLLSNLFAAISENKLSYNKVQHSVALTNWLLERSPESLREIADLLDARLPS